MSLTPTGPAQKAMGVSGPYNAQQYAVGYRIAGIPQFLIIPVTDAPGLAVQNLLMLIGRDMLSNTVLTYNGTTGHASLTW